jgi:hypothetical protein
MQRIFDDRQKKCIFRDRIEIETLDHSTWSFFDMTVKNLPGRFWALTLSVGIVMIFNIDSIIRALNAHDMNDLRKAIAFTLIFVLLYVFETRRLFRKTKAPENN